MSALDTHRFAARLCAQHYLAVFLVWGTVNGVCQCPLGRRCTSPGKHPIQRGWQDLATIDLALIDRWWSRHPQANIGICCGASGIIALDVDPRHGGDDTLADLIARYGLLPHTVETITGGGGRHILLASPSGITNASPFAGIDVRGAGGFIVAPGSIHASGGTYEWEASSHPDDVPIAPAPHWLTDLLRQPYAHGALWAPTPPRAAPMPERIPQGRRNDALSSLAGTLRNRGLVADEIYGCLLVVNRSRCLPPVADMELRMIAESMMRYPVGSAPLYATPPRQLRDAEWVAL
jgi:putative DNA primase/helicase